MPTTSQHAERRPKELTGRIVLTCLIAFFVVVIGVNMVLVRAAISTFGGLEAESSYKAGLAYGEEIAAARAQQARHWDVSAQLFPDKNETVIEVIARNANGQPLTGLDALVRLVHPTDRRLDQSLELHEAGAGRYRGMTVATKGEWHLLIELSRGTERVFRSENRVNIR